MKLIKMLLVIFQATPQRPRKSGITAALKYQTQLEKMRARNQV